MRSRIYGRGSKLRRPGRTGPGRRTGSAFIGVQRGGTARRLPQPARDVRSGQESTGERRRSGPAVQRHPSRNDPRLVRTAIGNMASVFGGQAAGSRASHIGRRDRKRARLRHGPERNGRRHARIGRPSIPRGCLPDASSLPPGQEAETGENGASRSQPPAAVRPAVRGHSTLACQPRDGSARNLAVTELIDRQFPQTPWHGLPPAARRTRIPASLHPWADETYASSAKSPWSSCETGSSLSWAFAPDGGREQGARKVQARGDPDRVPKRGAAGICHRVSRQCQGAGAKRNRGTPQLARLVIALRAPDAIGQRAAPDGFARLPATRHGVASHDAEHRRPAPDQGLPLSAWRHRSCRLGASPLRLSLGDMEE